MIKYKFYKNIKVKLLFWYLLIIFLVLSTFSLGLIYLLSKQLTISVDDKLSIALKDIQHDFLEHRYDYREIYEGDEFGIKPFYGKLILIEKGKSKILATSPKLPENALPSINEDILIKVKLDTVFMMDFETKRVANLLVLQERDKIFILQVATSREWQIKELNRVKLILLILNPLILLLSLIGGIFIIKKALKPIRLIIDNVKDIEIDDLSKRLDNLDSQDEIDELITTFNRIFERLENSFNNIKRFTQNASHELKTPLTVIRGEIEIALRKERSVKEYKESLQLLLNETKYLQNSIDNLLFLSSADKLTLQKSFKEVYLDELIRDSLLEKQKVAKLKDIKIELQEIEPTTIRANETLLKTAINNLIDNAIKYSHKNSKILINLQNSTLLIKDFGIGIKKEDIPFLFDRFFRSPEARKELGSGLGLSIVKTILDIHNFKIKVESKKDEFSSFIVEV